MFTNSLQWPGLLLPLKTAKMEMSHVFAFRRLLCITAHFSCCLNPSVFCCQSKGWAVIPRNCLWGTRAPWALAACGMRDQALCFLKRETTLRTTHIPQNLLEIFGIGWKCDYKWGDVAQDGWCEKLELACALQRDLNWWEQDFRLGSCLSSRWCRVHFKY